MKPLLLLLVWMYGSIGLFAQGTADTENPAKDANDVTWTTLGKNENDSMPIGNGDLAANVWTESNGDLVLLVAKADAWTGLGQLVKLGRIRIKLDPNPFVDSAHFTQELKLNEGAIEIRSDTNLIRIWVDANRPVLHVEAHRNQPGTFQANLELWRTDPSSPLDMGGLFEFGGNTPSLKFEPDTVLPAEPRSITWCHFNTTSVYPIVLAQEHLESLLTKYPDPLFHRCFGATLSGSHLVSTDAQTLKSAMPGQNFRLDLVAFTQQGTASPQDWQTGLESLVSAVDSVNLEQAWAAHLQWWRNFWNRSWIHVQGSPDAANVSQGYALQRWMMACSSRGAQPVKFNGGLFTVGHDLPSGKQSTTDDHSPDFRQWGNSYWNQNNRLLYWPLIATGDDDLLKPWFDMYLQALPLATDRTRLYYHHDGAAFIETMYFWGLPNIGDFGWNNPGHEMNSSYMKYHIQGALEVIAQMLDRYDYTQDADFARTTLLPFAQSIITYYDQHWTRGPDGKILMTPVQSLETYQNNATNPTPDIAGLADVLPRLSALPSQLITSDQQKLWNRVLHDLPAIPLGKTAGGKLPPNGQGDANGTPIILPAEKYGGASNMENPELYVAFPYRLYGVGKPGLDLARATYFARLYPQAICWGQDGTEASILGLTDKAKRVVKSEFTNYGHQRFIWFWAPSNDWIPDLDGGGSGMITLQQMLLQCDGKRIQLLPAWPSDWTADFKLCAPYQTTVEGHVENGKLTNLKVTPSSRSQDVVVLPVK